MKNRMNRCRRSPLPRGAFAQGGNRAVYHEFDPEAPEVEWIRKESHAFRERVKHGKIIRIPMSDYERKKFVKGSANHQEWEDFFRFFADLPISLRPCVARPFGLATHAEKTVLYMEPVRDANGWLSRSLREAGLVNDPYFWKVMDSLVAWMARRGANHFDLNSQNVLVRIAKDGKLFPVLVDFKDMLPSSYPMQPWLRIPLFARQKMRRKYARLKKEFGGPLING